MKALTTQRRFVRLRAQGFSFDKIAKRLKCSKNTLLKWDKILTNEVLEERQKEEENVKKEYCLMRAQRIKAIGEQVRKINKELAKRSYKDISTTKLYDLLLRSLNALKSENSDVVDLNPVDPAKVIQGEYKEDTKDDFSDVLMRVARIVDGNTKVIFEDQK